MSVLLQYYEDAQGNIQLPPDEECFWTICPPGFERREAHYLHEVDKVKDRLESDERRRLELEGQREAAVMAPRIKAIRENLQSRMSSSATSAYEREFISLYLQLSDERKRELYRQRFACDNAYFELREFDRKRAPDEVRKDINL